MMQSDEIERDGGARAHDERAAPDASVIESGPEAAAHGAPDRPSRAEWISRLIRRRTGTVAAAVAVVAFAAGVYGAYHLAAPRPDRRI
ncbi:MAG: hypothetical protein ACRDVE_21090, partial [Actinocrinis sp.]